MERLVYHLNGSSKFQHLDLINNDITAIGAYHFKSLMSIDHSALTITSIELS